MKGKFELGQIVATEAIDSMTEAGEESDKNEQIKKYIPAVAEGTDAITWMLDSYARDAIRRAKLIAAYADMNESYEAYKRKVIEHCGEQADGDV